MAFEEKFVAQLLGVPADELAIVRELLEEGECEKNAADETLITPAGVQKVLEAAEIPPEKLPATFWPDLEKNALRTRFAAVKKVTFLKGTHNRQLVLGVVDGEPVRVQVQSQENFRRGMIIPVVWVTDNVFKITRTPPRFPGRW